MSGVFTSCLLTRTTQSEENCLSLKHDVYLPGTPGTASSQKNRAEGGVSKTNPNMQRYTMSRLARFDHRPPHAIQEEHSLQNIDYLLTGHCGYAWIAGSAFELQENKESRSRYRSDNVNGKFVCLSYTTESLST